MKKALSELEQWAMDLIWASSKSSAEQIRTGLQRKRILKDSTVRTILRRLEDKGYVKHTVEGRTFLYQGVEQPVRVAAKAAFLPLVGSVLLPLLIPIGVYTQQGYRGIPLPPDPLQRLWSIESMPQIEGLNPLSWGTALAGVYCGVSLMLFLRLLIARRR